jgi:hypothetical protein
MANSAAKAQGWVDRLASHPGVPFGALLRQSFAAGKITRLCECGCNSFDLAVPDSGDVPRIAAPEPNGKFDRLVFEIVFETDLEDPSQLACLFFADSRGYLSSLEITGGWSNHAPVPDSVELRKIHYVNNRLNHAP